MTSKNIYKTYKHGGSLKGISPKRIFNALKNNELQVILVKDFGNKERVYNYVPETNTFYRIV